jgi:hypothetical protein
VCVDMQLLGWLLVLLINRVAIIIL